jgi:flagellar protein FlaJ
MPLQTALEHCSKRNYGPLTMELKLLVANMSWGMNFNHALMEFSKRIDLDTIRKASILIMEAQRHGGDLSDIFESTAKYVENINQWTARRRTQTMPYIAIFYFSVVIFLFIIIIVSNMLFAPFDQAAQNTATLGGVPLIKPVFSQAEAKRVFLHTALFESLFGGLVAGKINDDSFLAGLKHTAVLVAISGIAFFIFFQ